MIDEAAPPPAPAPAGAPPSPRAPAGVEQGRIVRWFFFGAFAFLIYQLLLILSLFSDAIIWAASLALVCFPIHKFLQRRLPSRDGAAAALSTLAVLLLVLVPTLFVLGVVVRQSAELYPTVRGWVAAFQSPDGAFSTGLLPGFLQGYWQRLSEFAGQSSLFAQFDLQEFMLGNINAASAKIANVGAVMARNILLGVVNLLLIQVLLFFCFRDGERFLHWLFDTVPMPVAQAQSIALRIYQTVTAVIRGALLTAVIQGLLAMIGYQIAGVPLAVFFGVMTGFAAMIPVVGAGLVWAPIGVFIFMKSPAWGVFVFAWGFFLVSLADNVLKPILIGSRARMPILLIFCGIIGGASVYGVTGLIIGPIVIASLLAFVTIYREHYSPESGGSAAAARFPVGEGASQDALVSGDDATGRS